MQFASNLASSGNVKMSSLPRCTILCFDRYGFNSHGLDIVKKRLQNNFERRNDGIVGVNVGRNKITDDPVGDFLIGVKELGALADYIVINVSSPNTPGLRKMQEKEELENLISKVNFIPGEPEKSYHF